MCVKGGIKLCGERLFMTPILYDSVKAGTKAGAGAGDSVDDGGPVRKAVRWSATWTFVSK